ncbi:HlyD family secretion protein [Acidithiobacillus sp. M4-SHS-6]|uniref:HlyD family secretion protein n=1 Tax=Acidithiobacillus sp. M4-SHS-6 TaxID=3383024 RepID=UPI0039BDD23A
MTNHRDFLGPIQLGSPVHHHVYAWTALALVTGILLILFLGHYTRNLPVSGTLVPSAGLLSVTSPLSGTVEKVLVHTNQSVQAGTPLLHIASNLYSPRVGLVNTLIEQSLSGEEAILHQNLHAEDSLSQLQRSALTTKLADLQQESAELRTEIQIQREDITSTQKVLQEFLSVKSRGLVSDPQLQQQRLAVYSARSQLAALRTRQSTLAQQISDTRQELLELPLNTQNQEGDLRTKLASLRQELAKTAGGHSLVLRAPSAGRVSALTVTAGQAVSAGSPVLSLMPRGDPLVAQLLVPSRAVAYLHRGTRVLLHYAAFPYRSFGAFHGTVESISQSALTPAEIATLTQQRSTVPLYRVLVQLDRTVVRVNGQPSLLRAGMQVRAEIPLNHLRLIQWVFEPLRGLQRDFFIQPRNIPPQIKQAVPPS